MFGFGTKTVAEADPEVLEEQVRLTLEADTALAAQITQLDGEVSRLKHYADGDLGAEPIAGLSREAAKFKAGRLVEERDALQKKRDVDTAPALAAARATFAAALEAQYEAERDPHVKKLRSLLDEAQAVAIAIEAIDEKWQQRGVPRQARPFPALIPGDNGECDYDRRKRQWLL